MLRIKVAEKAEQYAKDQSKEYSVKQHKSANDEATNVSTALGANTRVRASPRVPSNQRGARLGGTTPRITRGAPRTYLAQAAAEANKTAKKASEAAKGNPKHPSLPPESVFQHQLKLKEVGVSVLAQRRTGINQRLDELGVSLSSHATDSSLEWHQRQPSIDGGWIHSSLRGVPKWTRSRR